MRSKRKGFTLIELLVVLAIISTLAAIAIPNMLRTRISANEAAAASMLKAYSIAQVTFQTGKVGRKAVNSNSGAAGYCDNFRNLFYGNPVGASDENLVLISQAFANAFARDPAAYAAVTHNSPAVPPSDPMAVSGYLFAETKEMAADPLSFRADFAMIGVPLTGKITGDNAYWIGQQGTIWMSASSADESYTVSVNIDTPSNPAVMTAGAWIGY